MMSERFLMVVWAAGIGLFVHTQLARWRAFRKKRQLENGYREKRKEAFNARELIIAGSTVGLSFLVDWLWS